MVDYFLCFYTYRSQPQTSFTPKVPELLENCWPDCSTALSRHCCRTMSTTCMSLPLFLSQSTQQLLHLIYTFGRHSIHNALNPSPQNEQLQFTWLLFSLPLPETQIQAFCKPLSLLSSEGFSESCLRKKTKCPEQSERCLRKPSHCSHQVILSKMLTKKEPRFFL